jgi:hypothetical protein
VVDSAPTTSVESGTSTSDFGPAGVLVTDVETGVVDGEVEVLAIAALAPTPVRPSTSKLVTTIVFFFIVCSLDQGIG